MYEQKLIDKLDELQTLLAQSEINPKCYEKASAILLEIKQVLRQNHVSVSLPFVRVLMVNGSFIKGKLISLNGVKKQGVELKIDEKCLVEIEKNEPNCYQVNIIEIDKKYISDWRQ